MTANNGLRIKNYQSYELNISKQIQPLRRFYREKKENKNRRNTEEEIYLNKFTKNVLSWKRKKKKNGRNAEEEIYS